MHTRAHKYDNKLLRQDGAYGNLSCHTRVVCFHVECTGRRCIFNGSGWMYNIVVVVVKEPAVSRHDVKRTNTPPYRSSVFCNICIHSGGLAGQISHGCNELARKQTVDLARIVGAINGLRQHRRRRR